MEPQNSLSRTEALEVVIRGLYYFPAYKHHSQTPTNIWCDYCKRTGLNCSIGYQNYDLCLGCVEMLTNTNRTTQAQQAQQTQQTQQIQQTQQANHPNHSNHPNHPNHPNHNAHGFLQQNINQPRPSNDFGLEGNGSWQDQFNPSLNPSLNPSAPRFGTRSNGNKSAKSSDDLKNQIENFSSNSYQNQTQTNTLSNTLESFYQPLNPSGMKRG